MKYIKRIEKDTWLRLLAVILIWILEITVLKSTNTIIFIFDTIIACILTIEEIFILIIEMLYNTNPVEIVGIVSQHFEEECMDVTCYSFLAKTGKIPTIDDASFKYIGLYRLYNININDSMRNKCKNGNFIKFISNDNYSYNIKKLKEKPTIFMG